jgi:hypothetical protein
MDIRDPEKCDGIQNCDKRIKQYMEALQEPGLTDAEIIDYKKSIKELEEAKNKIINSGIAEKGPNYFDEPVKGGKSKKNKKKSKKTKKSKKSKKNTRRRK